MLLIISSAYDVSTNMLCHLLYLRGTSFFRINIDDHTEILHIEIEQNNISILLKIGNSKIEVSKFENVWYRNGYLFRSFIDKLTKTLTLKDQSIFQFHNDETLQEYSQ